MCISSLCHKKWFNSSEGEDKLGQPFCTDNSAIVCNLDTNLHAKDKLKIGKLSNLHT